MPVKREKRPVIVLAALLKIEPRFERIQIGRGSQDRPVRRLQIEAGQFSALADSEIELAENRAGPFLNGKERILDPVGTEENRFEFLVREAEDHAGLFYRLILRDKAFHFAG